MMKYILFIGLSLFFVSCTTIYDTDDFVFINAAENRLDCETYCETVIDVCTNENAQYTTNVQCTQLCSHMNVGTEEDTSGNTLGCRDNFSFEAAELPQANCVAAGPGGNGICGSNCESFCQLQNAICIDANQQFSSEEACLSACASLDNTIPYTSTVLSGNSLSCRISHLTLASRAPDTHCSHIALDSPVCN